MRRFLVAIVSAICVCAANAQDFNEYFEDATLRIDYSFSGDASVQSVSVAGLCTFDGWHGRRSRLAELPMEGNGQVTVRSRHGGEVIYRIPFSSLFQEWLSYPEANGVCRSFENVFLVPMPKDTVYITVELRNNRRETIATLTHTVVPGDILIRKIGRATTPYDTIMASPMGRGAVDIAFVAEGYTEGEMGTFMEDARKATAAIFAHEPFKGRKDKFNVVAVKSPSRESGTSEPSAGIWRETALQSHFDTFYSDRYLTTLSLRKLHDWLAGVPYEHIIVLVNSDKYGGGGILNSYNLTSTHHSKYLPVVVHEFGHSFAGLADEYAYETEDIPMYPHDVEPWERNITTLADFHGKWENDISPSTALPTKSEAVGPGLYEGAGYSLKGIYRAYPGCRMRDNDTPDFCPVCRKALADVIDFYAE